MEIKNLEKVRLGYVHEVHKNIGKIKLNVMKF